jgi:hypothetical protein
MSCLAGSESLLSFAGDQSNGYASLDNGQPTVRNPMNDSQNTPFGLDFNRPAAAALSDDRPRLC